MRTGSPSTHLIVLRGNSGSGKSSVAKGVREAYELRGLALVPQDVIRRQILREHDVPGAVNIRLIDTVVRFSLDAGYHVLLEGILSASRYGAMLQTLRRDHAGVSSFFYLDVSWPETVRRHDMRPQRTEFGPELMRDWYRERDLLPGGFETVISEDSSLDDTVRQVMTESGLADLKARAPQEAEA